MTRTMYTMVFVGKDDTMYLCTAYDVFGLWGMLKDKLTEEERTPEVLAELIDSLMRDGRDEWDAAKGHITTEMEVV